MMADDGLVDDVGVRLARLATTLTAQGALRSNTWREALLAVPRHVFLPRFYRKKPGTFDYEPVIREPIGDRAWLDLVYSDETWVTQVDGKDDLWSDHPRALSGRGTCSSTMPSLVVGMLESLDLSDDHTVLEVGTGTGYSTALLCRRLGPDRVVSVEVDRTLSQRAEVALAQLGFAPTLVVGDGALGFPDRAPYDRIIGSCSFTHVPYRWVEQTRSGGLIEVILTGSITGGPRVILEVKDDKMAAGMLDAQMLGFMVSRPQIQPPPPPGIIPKRDPSHERISDIDPSIFDDDRFQFLLQSRIPGLTYSGLFHPPDHDALFRTHDPERWAYVYIDDDDRLRVQESDSGAPSWTIIEDTARTWDRLGRPGLNAFRLTVASHQQTLTIPGEDTRWQVFF
ncbi:hypothetical protein FDG2_0250 [Candidatus Protofrankia californiensis]|uniref:Protein-L-isoaspartate O-methyltransferase n=1 Tax=Candidatus Protofrankia californiensis TaxID=1839754 RepID=A0A1C3NT62_9ACTN|nr:hypothetical protein FDG2_0250 [Candidatus Protofrankia californiensis]